MALSPTRGVPYLAQSLLFIEQECVQVIADYEFYSSFAGLRQRAFICPRHHEIPFLLNFLFNKELRVIKCFKTRL